MEVLTIKMATVEFITTVHGDEYRRYDADDWEKLCKKTESAKSRTFCEQCERILQRCTSFQNTIAAKNVSFTDKVNIDLVDIFDKVGNDNETIKTLLEQVIGQQMGTHFTVL